MAAALIGLLGKADPKLGADALRRFRDRRNMALKLRRFNRGLLVSDEQLRSIARCGNVLGGTVMFRAYQDGRTRPGGTATCKSVWGCLGCATRRRAIKSALVRYYVDAHLDAGKAVSFASFTLAHYPGDDLDMLLCGLREAFTDMRHLKVYRDAVARYGIVGWIASLEITHGVNGWHPHLHVLFFHEEFLDVEYGENADLKAALHEAFAHQIDRHLGRAVHQIHGVDLVPVKTAGDEDQALAVYLSKIQLEMTRQDLKTTRVGSSRSPWQIGLDAADTKDPQDTARWCEYLRATKSRKVVTRSKSLAETYGEPTDAELDQILGIDHDDDQATDTDEATDIGSADGDLWMASSNATTGTGGSLAAAALTALEDHGPQQMADVVAAVLGVAVEVTAHPETGLPHLRFTNATDPDRIASRRSHTADINPDDLGPAARAWYEATNQQSPETT